MLGHIRERATKYSTENPVQRTSTLYKLLGESGVIVGITVMSAERRVQKTLCGGGGQGAVTHRAASHHRVLVSACACVCA